MAIPLARRASASSQDRTAHCPLSTLLTHNHCSSSSLPQICTDLCAFCLLASTVCAFPAYRDTYGHSNEVPLTFTLVFNEISAGFAEISPPVNVLYSYVSPASSLISTPRQRAAVLAQRSDGAAQTYTIPLPISASHPVSTGTNTLRDTGWRLGCLLPFYVRPGRRVGHLSLT